MTQHDNDLGLYPSRSDIPPEVRAYMAKILNQTLVCTVDLRSQMKQAAWNIKGNACIQLHSLFDTIAIELDAYSDLLAERIAALGAVVRGTVRLAAIQSTLLEYPSDIVESDAHVRVLIERSADYVKAVRACITYAAEVEDAATANVYTDIARGIDKRLALLEAHLYC